MGGTHRVPCLCRGPRPCRRSESGCAHQGRHEDPNVPEQARRDICNTATFFLSSQALLMSSLALVKSCRRGRTEETPIACRAAAVCCWRRSSRVALRLYFAVHLWGLPGRQEKKLCSQWAAGRTREEELLPATSASPARTRSLRKGGRRQRGGLPRPSLAAPTTESPSFSSTARQRFSFGDTSPRRQPQALSVEIPPG